MGRRKRQKPPPMEALQSNHLPEVIYEILLRLPSKSLLKFKCVCKSWKALISDPKFIQSHLHLSTTSSHKRKVFCWYVLERCFSNVYYEDDGEIHFENLYFPREQYDARVFGSCHGLVLLKEHYSKASFFLWNPSVKRYTKFSFPFDFSRECRAGLCYDSSSDDYKVVAICDYFYCVYSLRNGTWAERKAFSYSSLFLSQLCVFADGFVYWVLRLRRNNVLLEDCSKEDDFVYDKWFTCEILRFNPEEGTFSVVPKPECVGDGYEFCLIEWGGRLGLYCYSERRNIINIWLKRAVQRGYNDVNNWEELVVVSNIPAPEYGSYGTGDVRPICYGQESDILVYNSDTEEFYLYDVKEERFHKKHSGPRKFYHRMTTVTYVDSLLLPGVGDKPKKKWLKTERRERRSTAQTSDGSTQKS